MITSLRKIASAVALVTASSCASMSGSMLPSGLTDALGSVSGLSNQITEWQSGLKGALDMPALETLQGYVDQAGALGTQVMGFQEKLTSAAADPLGAITSKLTDLGGFDVDALKDLAPAKQKQKLRGFTDSAASLGELTDDFLKQFGG